MKTKISCTNVMKSCLCYVVMFLLNVSPGFSQDSTQLSNADMFKKGYQDAKTYYKAPGMVGKAIGASFIPFGTMSLLSTPPDPNENRACDRKYLDDANYVLGYQKAAKPIKNRKVILGKGILVGASYGMMILMLKAMSGGHWN